MKVLALCTTRTLPLMRRVLAPFSVLASRAHRFEFQEVVTFDPTISYGYDVTLLHQWVLTETEMETFRRVARERTFVYDLADPALLTIPEVQETLRLCALVTVPNEYLRKEVALFNRRVKILPSTIDFQFFMHGRHVARNDVPTIGCFGPHDWSLVREAVTKFQILHPRTVFLGDRRAVEMLGPFVKTADMALETYPATIHHCWAGLCPFDGDNGQDTIWGLEYGILNKPIVASSQSSYTQVLPQRFMQSHRSPCAVYVKNPKSTDAWMEAMAQTLTPDTIAIVGKAAYAVAYAYKSIAQAGDYQHVYEKMLPHLTMVG